MSSCMRSICFGSLFVCLLLCMYACTSCACVRRPSSLSPLGLLFVACVIGLLLIYVTCLHNFQNHRLQISCVRQIEGEVPSRAICPAHTHTNTSEIYLPLHICVCINAVATKLPMQLIVAIFNFELWPAISHWMQVNAHTHTHAYHILPLLLYSLSCSLCYVCVLG